MNYLLIFFLFHFVIFIFAKDLCEDNSSDRDHWLCESNQDHTVNVTYDCLHGNEVIAFYTSKAKLTTIKLIQKI